MAVVPINLACNGCLTVQKSKSIVRNKNTMETKEKTIITVQAKIKAPVERVWKLWTTPKDIV